MKPQKKLTKQELKTDEFVTLTTNAIVFATARKYQILVALSIILVLIFGGLTGVYIKRMYDERASDQLSTALRLYNPDADEQSPEQKSDPKVLAEASDRFNEIFEGYSRSKVASQALFYHAVTLLKQARTDEAIAALELFLQRFPLHPYKENVQTLLASALMTGEKYQKALEILDELAAAQKGTPAVSMTMLHQGMCYMQLQQYKEAREKFQAIISEYETTPWVTEAKDYLLLVPAEVSAGTTALSKESMPPSPESSTVVADPTIVTETAEELTGDVEVAGKDDAVVESEAAESPADAATEN